MSGVTAVSSGTHSEPAEGRRKRLEGKKIYVSDWISCSASQVNVQRYVDFVTLHGGTMTTSIKNADIVLLDTCAFDLKREDASIKSIKYEESRAKEGAKVVVCGCLAGINPQKLQEHFKGEFFSPKNEQALATILDLNDEESRFLTPFEARGRFVGPTRIQADKWGRRSLYWCLETLHKINDRVGLGWVPFINGFLTSLQTVNPNAYAVNISQGCLGNCSFCVIPQAKGRTLSLSPDLIVDKISCAVEKGIRRVILAGEDTGAYGRDINENIADLLKRIQKLQGEFTVHIAFFDPRWLLPYGKELTSAIESGKIAYLQLPLQSGSNSVLKRMRRAYRIDNLLPIIKELKRQFPRLILGSQFIAGFPGETADEFEETRSLIKEGFFEYADVFDFCDRPGAETNHMPDHLPKELIERRGKTLRRDWLLSLGKNILKYRGKA